MSQLKSNISRKSRLETQIQQIIALELMNNIKDEILKTITIIEVILTGDLHDAKVYFTVHSEIDAKFAEKLLNRAKGRFRKALAEQLHTRLTPSIEFVADELSDRVANIDNLLANVAAADLQLERARQNAKYAGDENPYKI